MPITYEILATNTINANQNTMTFSSISQSYTDLRLVANIGLTASGEVNVRCNGNTGTNYYSEVMTSLGTNAPSAAIEGGGATNFVVSGSAQQSAAGSGPNNSLLTMDFNSYTFGLNKPVLWEYGFVPGDGARNTKRTACGNFTSGSAISSVTVATNQSFINGTTFTLFGILKA